MSLHGTLFDCSAEVLVIIIMADPLAMIWFLYNEMFNVNAIEQEIRAMGEEADDVLLAVFILLNAARDRYRRSCSLCAA